MVWVGQSDIVVLRKSRACGDLQNVNISPSDVTGGKSMGYKLWLCSPDSQARQTQTTHRLRGTVFGRLINVSLHANTKAGRKP